MWNTHYDVIIVGGGVVGCTLAHALSTIKREKPLRIAVLERSLEEPDRIVGELLQPGGVASLKELGLEWTLEGIDAVPVYGYCVVNKGKTVHIPYPDGREGRSFHHGKFIMNLREAARRAEGVDLIEATVTSLIESNFNKKVTGVRATRKDGVTTGVEADKESFFADLVIVADGCFSNFRAPVMAEQFCKPVTKSHFVGLVLEDAVLPIPKHGTVVLVKDHGPVLLYQIAEHDTRLLIDIKQPLPADLKVCLSPFFTPSRTLILFNRTISPPASFPNCLPLFKVPFLNASRVIASAVCPIHSCRPSSKARPPFFPRKASFSSAMLGTCGIRLLAAE